MFLRKYTRNKQKQIPPLYTKPTTAYNTAVNVKNTENIFVPLSIIAKLPMPQARTFLSPGTSKHAWMQCSDRCWLKRWWLNETQACRERLTLCTVCSVQNGSMPKAAFTFIAIAIGWRISPAGKSVPDNARSILELFRSELLVATVKMNSASNRMVGIYNC